MRLVCISDTHDHHEDVKLPDGDILIHAGDFTSHKNPNMAKTIDFNNWLGRQSHKHKIIIAGNHDTLFEGAPYVARSLITNATYLEEDGIEIEGLKFWGSPYTLYWDNWAFNVKNDLRKHWSKIPTDTDVLITHGPARDIRDYSFYSHSNVGDRDLADRLMELPNLKLHVFGHIHDGYGIDGIHVNAALCNDNNQLVGREPIVIDL